MDLEIGVTWRIAIRLLSLYVLVETIDSKIISWSMIRTREVQIQSWLLT